MTTLNLFDPAFLVQLSTVNSITPETFGPVYRWYDAVTLNYKSDGAAITPSDPWNDKSPNGLSAVSTLTNEPVFKTAVLNGKPAVRFTVGSKRMVFTGGALSLDNFTILVVAMVNADSIFLSKNGINVQGRVRRLGANTASWKPEPGNEIVSNAFPSNAADTRMIGYRRSDNNSDLRDVKFFDNGSLIERPLSGVDSTIFDPNQIGIIDGGPLNIDIGELVIYNRALTTGEVQTLYTEYFKPKFLLP